METKIQHEMHSLDQAKFPFNASSEVVQWRRDSAKREITKQHTVYCDPKSLSQRFAYSSGTSISPALIASITSCGGEPSIVHPTDWAVPKISLTPPARSLDSDLDFIVRAIS